MEAKAFISSKYERHAIYQNNTLKIYLKYMLSKT